MTEDDDAKLVAFLDNELDAGARREIEVRLKAEADLAARLAEMKAGGRPFEQAFEALLAQAPVARLRAGLARLETPSESAALHPRRFLVASLGLAAAIVLFCAGVGFGRFGLDGFGASEQTAGQSNGQREDWRQAVAEYMTLYTADTFATPQAAQQRELTAVGGKIGLDLTTQNVALKDLTLKGAQILNFEGAPLGELAYLDPATGPVLFCIIANSEPVSPIKAESRRGLSVASWARAGRGFMLIGRLPETRLAELAQSLEQRF